MRLRWEKLLETFESKEFMQAYKAGELHKWELVVDTPGDDSVVKVVFPGYKSKIRPLCYDYRVDIVKGDVQEPLSHPNIIIDLYNKCERRRELIPDLRMLLGNIILEGNIDSYQSTQLLREYEPVSPPSARLLDRVEQVYKEEHKTFSRVGNQWDLSIRELISIVKWIVLQEDINYPMPRYQGRGMSFARYLEAIHCAEKRKEVDEVVRRAIIKDRKPPPPWGDVDYSIIDRVKSGAK